jgi:hypothetical protein
MNPSPLLAFLLVTLALLPILTLAIGVALGQRLARAPSAEQLRPAERPKTSPEHHRKIVEGFLPPSKRGGASGHWRMILVFSWWPDEETPRRTREAGR